MNEYALCHVPDSRYCFAVGDREVVLRLRADRYEKIRVYLVYGGKYEYQRKQKEQEIYAGYTDRLYDYYEARLRLEDVRLAYVFRIEEGGKSYYYSEDGLTEQYDFEKSFYHFFQLPYINRADIVPTVNWMKGAVFYQIFPDRFRRGDWKKEDSYIDLKWGGRPTPKNFAGGDLKGIIEKLDYIKGLGVTAIYLTPIFASVSNHKYDIMDYRTVDPQFGTNEDLRELVRRAHEQGIRIVLDAVFNHCSERMEQFQDVLSRGKDSPYFDWFLIDGDEVDQKRVNYECFASCSYMPKLNTSNEALQDFLLEVARFWIREADIDGWRLDVSDEVSHVFWRRFREAVKDEKEDFVIIGENWHDAYPFLRGDQFDCIMNYSFTKACLDYFAWETMDAAEAADKLNGNLMRNQSQVNEMMLNLLDSHDTLRFLTEVKGNKDRLLCAIALLVSYQGAMSLYYGTEIGMEGGYDPDSRRCFDWDETNWDMELLDKVRELLALKRHAAIRDGEIRISSEDGMLKIAREIGTNVGNDEAREIGTNVRNDEVSEIVGNNEAREDGMRKAARETGTRGAGDKAGKSGVELWINLTSTAKRRSEWDTMKLLMGHHYEEGELSPDGFVMVELP